MSRIENVTIKIKNAKLKNIDKICYYFSEDFTAIETSKILGVSRQTINNYYKILRERLESEFASFDTFILDELLKFGKLNIKYMNLSKEDIFFLNHNNIVFIFKDIDKLYINELFDDTLKETLKNHKKANCVRILLNQNKKSFIVSGFFNNKEKSFEEFLEKRLKKFRGINKDRFYSYLKESQIRFNTPKEIIYQHLILSFK